MQLMLPDPDQDDDPDDSYDRVAKRSRSVADFGLAALQILARITLSALDDQALLTLIAFTDGTEAWTTSQTAVVAREVLTCEMDDRGTEGTRAFIVKTVLEEYIRPLFSKARPATVTPRTFGRY